MNTILSAESFERRIYLVRGQRVMLDRELAELYGVTTGNLNKAVSRNQERFPEDFMFPLTPKEHQSLRFQFGILNRGGHSKYPPRVFTEQGVAMLSGVLHGSRAVHVNVGIMRAFVKLRRLATSYPGLARRLDRLESRYDSQFKEVFDAIRDLMSEPEGVERRIGFKARLE